MPQVDVATLCEWLASNTPVTVLDVRTDEDRAQWSIPGSLHVNAYDALKQRNPNALAGVTLPAGRPIVTVCNRGKVSRIAAERLRAEGFEALSLEGGMQAWSLAWNIALPRRREARSCRDGFRIAHSAGRNPQHSIPDSPTRSG